MTWLYKKNNPSLSYLKHQNTSGASSEIGVGLVVCCGD